MNGSQYVEVGQARINGKMGHFPERLFKMAYLHEVADYLLIIVN